MAFGYIDRVELDFVTNGRAQGSMANHLATAPTAVSFDPGLLRPMIMNDGRKYCWLATGHMTTNKQGKEVPEREPIPVARLSNNGMVPPALNASALPFRTWERIDRAVIKASRLRLNAWNDLAAANTYSGFDGMATTGIARDTITDPGDAKVDMETLTDDLNDAPLVTTDIVPLPIIHAGAFIPQRRLAQSRAAGMPLDTVGIEAAGQRCGETLEKMTIGVDSYTTLVIGSSTDYTRRGIYGFCTQPDRITKIDLTDVSTITQGTTQPAFKTDVLEMLVAALDQNFRGPFVLYYSTHYDEIMEEDYWVLKTSGATSPTKTMRQRLQEIEGITKIQRLDYLTSAQTLILVQMSSETVRAVNGLDWLTVQWEEQGGARVLLRVMGIKLPDLRAQYVGTSVSTRKCGIVHGTTS